MENLKYVPFAKINIADGFWKDRQTLNANVSIPNVYKRFDETDRFKAIYPWWKAPFSKSHIFFDSDTAKWIEGAAYVLQKERENYAELEKLCDDLIDRFAALQAPNGYLNSFFQRHIMPRFRFRALHELYCAGHLIEAAVAYKDATGKDKLLKVTEKYVDYIRKRFIKKQNTGFTTPGHEEIELALFKLYKATGNEKYKETAEFFINKRGAVKEKNIWKFNANYDQHDRPVRELNSAEGHAVRAMYLYCGMADMARLNNDQELFAACKRLFDDACKKAYITGGIGSDFNGECFTVDYDLPNMIAYSESCAAISFLMFCRRLLLLENDVRYADMIERIMYNNLLSAVSLDGNAFFYENPLEIRQAELTRSTSVNIKTRFPAWTRQEVFSCSCCPPNLVRQIASIGDVIFTEDENKLVLQQFIPCVYDGIKIETDFPLNGKVKIFATRIGKKLLVRVPSWCKNYSIKLNGKEYKKAQNGYVDFAVSEKAEIEIDFDMTPFYVHTNPLCKDNIGKVTLMRGPVAYCLESVDNDNLDGVVVKEDNEVLEYKCDICPLPVLKTTGYKAQDTQVYSSDGFDLVKKELTFIPYYAFANRGVADMKVWVPFATGERGI